MKNTKKILVMTLAALLLVAVSVGGTLAWLTDKTEEVKNTFSPADIDIELYETMHPTDDEQDVAAKPYIQNWKAQLIPGAVYRKNPQVVVKGSENPVDIYLFVKFEENVNEDVVSYDFLLDDGNNGWTALTGVTGVWYKEIAGSTTDTTIQLLKDDKVTVVKKNTDQANTTGFEMKFTAYAIQSDYLTNDSGATITDMVEIYKLAGGVVPATTNP